MKETGMVWRGGVKHSQNTEVTQRFGGKTEEQRRNTNSPIDLAAECYPSPTVGSHSLTLLEVSLGT